MRTDLNDALIPDVPDAVLLSFSPHGMGESFRLVTQLQSDENRFEWCPHPWRTRWPVRLTRGTNGVLRNILARMNARTTGQDGWFCLVIGSVRNLITRRKGEHNIRRKPLQIIQNNISEAISARTSFAQLIGHMTFPPQNLYHSLPRAFWSPTRTRRGDWRAR